MCYLFLYLDTFICKIVLMNAVHKRPTFCERCERDGVFHHLFVLFHVLIIVISGLKCGVSRTDCLLLPPFFGWVAPFTKECSQKVLGDGEVRFQELLGAFGALVGP